MLNNAVNWSAHARALQQHGVVSIPSALATTYADSLHHAMAQEVPYTLAYRLNGQDLEAEIDPKTETEIIASIAQAKERFTYAYDSYHLVKAYLANDRRVPVLRELLEFLNSPPFLATARAITGDPALRRVDAQATRYRPGHFLRTHNDLLEEEKRRFAYVLYLTRNWRSDFGGLFAFTNDADHIKYALKPEFNQLLIFKVPHLHHVTAVSAVANEPRLAISGWFSH